MSFFESLIGFCLITWLSMVSSQTHHNETQASELTVYEMMEKFNLPKGILPEGAKGYVLHEDNRFEVYFDRDCKFNLQGGYTMHYGKKVSGKVGYGTLTELKGVSVKIFFLWLGINEVSRGDENLDVYVGPIATSFPLSVFEECPICGRDVDCPKLLSDS